MNASANSLPAKARYKCWVVWAGPTADIKKTFYSYDSSGRYDVEKPDEYGLKGLQKRVVRQYPEKMKRAIIYDNQTGTKLLELQNGQWVDAQS